MKQYEYSSEVISVTATSQSETKDCSVRAFATALRCSYDAAHTYVKEKFNREHRKGVYGMQDRLVSLSEETQECDGIRFDLNPIEDIKLKNIYKVHGELIERRKTVKSFIESFPAGTYLVLVSRHVFTVCDGIIIDNRGEEFRPTRRVESACEVVIHPTAIQEELSFS